ncbi:MAG: hypothetical protein ABIJ08_04905 [Nanoarchaeota archaeon]
MGKKETTSWLKAAGLGAIIGFAVPWAFFFIYAIFGSFLNLFVEMGALILFAIVGVTLMGSVITLFFGAIIGVLISKIKLKPWITGVLSGIMITLVIKLLLSSNQSFTLLQSDVAGVSFVIWIILPLIGLLNGVIFTKIESKKRLKKKK